MENVIEFNKSKSSGKSRRELLEEWKKNREGKATHQLRGSNAPATPVVGKPGKIVAPHSENRHRAGPPARRHRSPGIGGEMGKATVDKDGFCAPSSRPKKRLTRPGSNQAQPARHADRKVLPVSVDADKAEAPEISSFTIARRDVVETALPKEPKEAPVTPIRRSQLDRCEQILTSSPTYMHQHSATPISMRDKLKLWQLKKRVQKMNTKGSTVRRFVGGISNLDFSPVYDALLDGKPEHARQVFSRMRVIHGAAVERNVDYWVERAAMEEYLGNHASVADLYEKAYRLVPKVWELL